jgi:hypothetical protein
MEACNNRNMRQKEIKMHNFIMIAKPTLNYKIGCENWISKLTEIKIVRSASGLIVFHET